MSEISQSMMEESAQKICSGKFLFPYIHILKTIVTARAKQCCQNFLENRQGVSLNN